MKQSTITRKQENKGMRAILDLTGQLSQVLKQFDGIYGAKLPDTDGLTVESWMSAHGVRRFVTPKGVKKGYTPALLNDGWCADMLLKSDDGKVMGNCVFKNVAAKYMREEDGFERAYRVYASEKDALDSEAKGISLYKLVQIPNNKWSVRMILKGLVQSEHYEKEDEKRTKSAEEWANVEECWIAVKDEETKLMKAVKVSKDEVLF